MPVTEVLVRAASKPTAVLFDAVLLCNADIPTAVLLEPVKFESKENSPNAELFAPVVFATID